MSCPPRQVKACELSQTSVRSSADACRFTAGRRGRGGDPAEGVALRGELARAHAQLQDAEAEVLRLAGRAARSARLEREQKSREGDAAEATQSASRERERADQLSAVKRDLETRLHQ